MRPVRMPVIPAIRPCSAINNVADMPIKIPPINEIQGVNSVSNVLSSFAGAGTNHAIERAEAEEGGQDQNCANSRNGPTHQ